MIVRPPFIFGSAGDDEIDSSAAAGSTAFSAALIVVLGAVLQSNVFVLLRMLRGKWNTMNVKRST